MADPDIYTLGGTVDPERGVYIPRPADDELLNNCLAGQFCYVLNSRQSGKSSLMVYTMRRLEQAHVRAVSIDLSSLGTSRIGEQQWYLSLADAISEQLALEDAEAWWKKNGLEQSMLTPRTLFRKFLLQVVLASVPEPLVVFVDEIDVTLELSYSDDFYALIRSLYNARATEPDLRRLAFVLLGVAEPTQLIRNDQHTPFNIGVKINLTDFRLEEARPLMSGLEASAQESERILQWILSWTGGHPYLTQLVCSNLAHGKTAGPLNAQQVADVVHELFLRPGALETNLAQVRERFMSRDPVAALKLYAVILSDGRPSDDDRLPVVNQLKLAGLVKSESGCLVPRNKIYRSFFDAEWVKGELSSRWEGTRPASFAPPAPARTSLVLSAQDRLGALKLRQTWLSLNEANALDLERARWRITAGQYWEIRAVAAAIFFGGTWLVSGGWVVPACWAGVAGWFLPRAFALQRQRGILESFHRQFPDVLEFMARAMRAGHSFSVTLEMAAREFSEPAGSEFRRVYEEQNLGRTMDDAFSSFERRISSRELGFFVRTVKLQKRTGSNLAETIDKMAQMVRDKTRLAGRRGTMWLPAEPSFLILLAALMIVVQWMAFPGYFAFALQSRSGQFAIATSYGLVLAMMLASASLDRSRRELATEDLGRDYPSWGTLDLVAALACLCPWFFSVPWVLRLGLMAMLPMRFLQILLVPVAILGTIWFRTSSGVLFTSQNWLWFGIAAPILLACHVGWLIWRRRRQRNAALARALPNAVDLLTVCVESGLGIDQAMAEVSNSDNPLAPAFGETCQELRAGRRRVEALRNMAERSGLVDLRAFVAQLIQADRFGTGMAQTVRAFSTSLREKVKQQNEAELRRLEFLSMLTLNLLVPALTLWAIAPLLSRLL